MSSEFTFGDNSDKLSIFQFLMNLVDRDLTEYQINQTLTLSRLHAQLEQTRGIRLFTHTKHVDWSRQGESDCLIILWSEQVILSFNLPLNAVRFVRIRGVTSRTGSMTNTAWLRSTHRRCFSCWNLVCVVYVGKPGELEQIVNIPVSQIVEEIAEVSKSLIVWSSILNLYFAEIEAFLA